MALSWSFSRARSFSCCIRAIGVDVNQDGLSFGVATARFQRDVEAELLGDDVAEWLPDRNDDKGLQWMTGGTEEAMLRTRQHEKERAREKHQLNAIMVPGGIDGLERSQRDPRVGTNSSCWPASTGKCCWFRFQRSSTTALLL